MKLNRTLYLFIFILYLFLICFFSVFRYYSDKQKIIEGQKSSLYMAASSLDMLLEKNFHDLYSINNPYPQEEYRALVSKLDSYAQIMNVEYVYSLVKIEELIFFVVSNETEDDRNRGTYSHFFNFYPNPPDILMEAFEAEEIVYSSVYENNWDTFYSVFIPKKTESGTTYILAADIKQINRLIIFRNKMTDSTILALILLIPILPLFFILHIISKKREDELLQQIYTDELTGLPNRSFFLKTCNEFFLGDFSAMMFDVDSFKDINNLFGGNVGDLVLKRIAELIQFNCREEDTLFKFPADEFVVLTAKDSLEEIVKMAKSILSTISIEEFASMGQPLNISLSCGVVYKAENRRKLLASVNMAKNLAKRDRQGVAVYDKSLNLERQYEDNYYWLNKLNIALREDRIVPFYQPIFNMKTGEIDKFEALVRMIDTDGTVIPPSAFLEVAQKSKLYRKITRTMISKALADFRDEPFSVSINFTAKDLLDQSTIDFLLENVKDQGMENKTIIELVESESVLQYETTIELTHKFHSRGIKVAIDDFGSGYSNFEYLLQLQRIISK